MNGAEPKHCIQRLIPVVEYNIMDFSTSSFNAKTQNKAEGLLKREQLPTSRGRTVGAETQKKNNYLNSWVDGDTTGDIETK